jgi:hypothetical protein
MIKSTKKTGREPNYILKQKAGAANTFWYGCLDFFTQGCFATVSFLYALLPVLKGSASPTACAYA